MKMRHTHRQTVQIIDAVKKYGADAVVVCMMKFCDPEEFQIILATDVEHYDIYTLKELLPLGFGPGNLKEK